MSGAPPTRSSRCCPGRSVQAPDLLRLLAPAPAFPVLLYGGAATGKTRSSSHSATSAPIQVAPPTPVAYCSMTVSDA